MTNAGLYIHVPFCTSVCPYCDFAVTIASADRRAAYLDALDREIANAAGYGFRFDTVYFGGGTPSSLAPDQLGRILSAVTSRLEVAPGAVRYLEINPEDVSDPAVVAWRDLGIDFVSLGIQSFDDEALAFLGRRHRAAAARRAVEILRDAGFPTVSIDLIFGLPDQRIDDWRRQLETVLSLGVDHLSCYQLTIHEGTVFGRRRNRHELHELEENGHFRCQAHQLLHLDSTF